MNVLAIAGSLRKDSYNRQLAATAQKIMNERHPEVEFTILNWSDVPLFNQDIEYPTPESVERVRNAVSKADGLWLFSPEYNHAIPGPLKNLLDWLSRPIGAGAGHVLATKPIALAGASIGMSGAMHAQEQLVNMLSFLNAYIMNKSRLSISSVGSQAEDGVLALTTSLPYLEKQADTFVEFIKQGQK